MSEEKHLSMPSKGFLLVIALGADGTKILLDYLFGVGIILDPLIISPVTQMIFWVVFFHNDVPMFSGRFASAGWINLFVSITPGVDALPDWTAYTCYIIFYDGFSSALQGIIGG
jgi:hypothetical protein